MEVFDALQFAATFHCQVDYWHTCDEDNPKTKERWTPLDPNRKKVKHQADGVRLPGITVAR